MTTMKQRNNNYWFLAFWCSLLMLVFSLKSCSPRVIKQDSRIVQKDSIYYSVNYIKKDTLIYLQGDTIESRVPIHLLTEKPLITKSKRGQIELSKVNDTIVARCEIDDLKEKITLLTKEIKGLKILSESKENTTIEKKSSPIKETLSLFGFFFLIYLLILLYKHLKP